MNQVTLKADGMLAAGEMMVGAQPLLYLGYQVHLAPDCTLRSYFRMLEAYAPFAQLGDLVQVVRQQYDHCPAQGCLWPEYQCLEFFKTVEMIGYPGQPRLEIYNAFHGIKDAATEEIRALPLAVLLDMPIRLGKLKHVVFGDTVDIFTFDTGYTLFEFIDSIAWELSFHGAPPECQLRS
jgi:hypothetical protein